MNRQLVMLLGGASAAATTWATPAVACTWPAGPSMTAVFHNRTVPVNAELWITHSRGYPGFEDGFELVAPDGTVMPVTTDLDVDHIRIVDAPLTPGTWHLQTVQDNGFDWPFVVEDVLDETPPPAPAAAIESQQRGGLGNLFSPCGGSLTPYTQEQITATFDLDDTAVIIVDGQVYAVLDDGEIRQIREPGGDVVVTAIDFAGNETQIVVENAQGGGCASAPASTSALALALVLHRGRRRRR